MVRAGRIALAICILAGASQVGAQSALPQGTPSEEALRKLAAQLGAPPSGLAKLTAQEKELLEFLTKQAETNPNFRRDLQELVKNDPSLIQRAKETQPELMESIRKQFPPNDPRLPPPGETKPPPNIPGQPTPPGDGSSPPMPSLPRKNPAEDNREFQEMAKIWEQTFGPLDNTPAVKQALLDMLTGSPGSKPGGKPFWADWDSNNGQGGNNPSFAKWLQGLNGGTGNSKLKLPKWFGGQAKNLQAPSLGKIPTAPKMPSMGFSGFDLGIGGISGLGTAGTALVVVLLAALVAFLVWKYAPQLGLARKRTPRPLPGLGPWPLDARTISDRRGLIVAFEYISVLLCGDGARVWNHATIADALRDSVPAAAPFADPLAKLYALARYTPQSEQLSNEAVAEARGYLCQLAGVPAA